MPKLTGPGNPGSSREVGDAVLNADIRITGFVKLSTPLLFVVPHTDVQRPVDPKLVGR